MALIEDHISNLSRSVRRDSPQKDSATASHVFEQVSQLESQIAVLTGRASGEIVTVQKDAKEKDTDAKIRIKELEQKVSQLLNIKETQTAHVDLDGSDIVSLDDGSRCKEYREQFHQWRKEMLQKERDLKAMQDEYPTRLPQASVSFRNQFNF